MSNLIRKNGVAVKISIICEGCGKVSTVKAYYDHVSKFCSLKCSAEKHNKKTMPDFCVIDGCGKPNHIGGLCQMHHRRKRYHGDPLYKPAIRLCSVSGCNKKHKAHGLCKLHFSRQKNGIPMDFVAPKLAKKRYRMLKSPLHPLADALGRVTEHRMVLFSSIGFSRVPCFWCGAGLVFGENLFVDHLNHDRHDNRLENLVPACNGCNAGRTINNSHIRTSVYSLGSVVGS